MKCLRVLLIDDDADFIDEAEKTLSREKYSVTAVSDFEEAAGFLRRVKGRAVVLSGLEVGERCGIAFLKDTLRRFPQVPFTFLTASPPLESVIEALKQGAYDFLRKPVAPAILFHSVARSIEKLNLSLDGEKIEREAKDRLSRVQAELKQRKLVNELKGFIISMAAHDFKSIFTVLDGYYQVLEEHCLQCPNLPSTTLLEQIGRSIRRLGAMANTLLDYEAAEKGQLKIETKAFDLAKMLHESVTFYRPYADLKLVSLSLETDLPRLKAKGDPERVMQILDNLLYNAIKFTPRNGQIRVGAREEDGEFATAWVHDTGIGIPKSQLEKIFTENRIAAGKDASARIGLGLNICRKLLEIQNGKIWLESEPGKGTKVFFSLPLQ